MAGIKQLSLVVCRSGSDGTVKFRVNLFRHALISLVKIFRPVILVEVKLCKALTGLYERGAYLGHSLHINVKLYAQLLAEDPHQLYTGSGRTSAEPPDVGIYDVYTLDDSGQDSCQAVTGSTVCVEIHINLKRLLEFRHQRENT